MQQGQFCIKTEKLINEAQDKRQLVFPDTKEQDEQMYIDYAYKNGFVIHQRAHPLRVLTTCLQREQPWDIRIKYSDMVDTYDRIIDVIKYRIELPHPDHIVCHYCNEQYSVLNKISIEIDLLFYLAFALYHNRTLKIHLFKTKHVSDILTLNPNGSEVDNLLYYNSKNISRLMPNTDNSKFTCSPYV